MLVRSDAVAVASVCLCKNTFSSSYRKNHFFFDGVFTPGMPVALHFALHLMSLVGRVPVNAAVRPLRVVELHRIAQSFRHLPQAGEGLAMQQLVLDGAVDTLGHSVVLRIAVLGHAGDDIVGFQHVDVCRAGVLGDLQGNQFVTPDWLRMLSSSYVMMLQYYPQRDLLFVGTNGQGVFVVDLANKSFTNLFSSMSFNGWIY